MTTSRSNVCVRVDALQQERQPRDVGIDLVEDVGERDDVAGPLRDADLARRPASASRAGRAGPRARRPGSPSASMPACSDFTWPWWSAPQMSMRCVQARGRTCRGGTRGRCRDRWWRRRTARARGRAGRRSRWSAASVAPSCSYTTPRASRSSSTSATSPRSCSVRSENQVSKCTPMRPRSSCRPCDDRRGSPTRTPARRVTSSPSSARMPVGHVDEVLALVAVLGRLLALGSARTASRANVSSWLPASFR